MRAINILLPVGLVLMILQGVLVMKRPGVSIKGRILGWLSLLFATLAAIVSWFASEGQLILSPEFGAAMFQGPWYVEVVMKVFIVAMVVGAGLGWYVNHIDRNNVSRFSVLLICMVGIAFVAIQPYRVLNLEEVDQLHIHAYELWWPATLGWVVFCVSDSVFWVAGMRNIPLRIWLATTILGLLSLHALGRPVFIAAPSTQAHWEAILSLCLILGAVLPIAALYFSRQNTVSRRAKLWLAILLVVIGVLHWLSGREIGWSKLSEKYAFIIFLIFPVYAVIEGAVRVFHGRNNSQNLIQALKGIWKRLSEYRESLFPLALLTIFVASLADFLHFEILGALPALLIWILSLVALYETTLKRPLCTYAFGTWPSKGTFSETRLAQCFGICGKSAQAVMKPISEKFWSLIKVDSVSKATVLILGVFVLLIAIDEIPNSGKTIIEPFVVQSVLYDLETARAEQGYSDVLNGKSPNSTPSTKVEHRTEKSIAASSDEVAARRRTGLGTQIAEKLRGKMIEYRPVLEPEIVPNLAQTGKDKTDNKPDNKPKSISFAMSGNGMDTVNVGSGPLEVGGVKIPLPFFGTPIQIPVRALLNVRVIQGSLVYDAVGYTLTARASTGEAWTVFEPRHRLSRSDDAFQQAQEIDTAINTLSSKLAFLVLLHLGGDDSRKVHTESWQAFAELKEGFDEWQRFQSTNDYQKLTNAIHHFQEAVSHDQNYPLAHYRLGLALLWDHRASEALRSLQESTRAGADFTPGHLAAAQAWLLQDQFKFQPINAPGEFQSDSRKPTPNEKNSTKSKPLNPRDHRLPANEWGEVIKSCATKNCEFELPSASYGLCSYHWEQAQKKMGLVDQRLAEAFYYCKRSAYLYAQLYPKKPLAMEIKKEWASALNEMGEIVQSLGSLGSVNHYDESQTSEVSWNCGRMPSTYFTSNALKYFERATVISPDDIAIKCNWASAAAALKNVNPMQVLKRDPIAHFTNAYRNIEILKIAELLLRQVQIDDSKRSDRLDPNRDTNTLMIPEILDSDIFSFWKTRIADLKRSNKIDLNQGIRDLKIPEIDELIEFLPLQMRINHLERSKSLEPNQVESLNSVAYEFWQWQLTHPFRHDVFEWKGRDVLLNAEMDSRRAITVMRDGREREIGWKINSTLGEILLAQARPIEAIGVLEKAVLQMDYIIGEDYGETKNLPKNPMFDEMRWDLVQAYLCAAQNEKDAANKNLSAQLNRIGDLRSIHHHSQIQSWERKAAALLNDIRKNEQLLQDSRFASDSLDPMRTKSVCRRSTLLRIERVLKPIPTDDYSVKVDYEPARQQVKAGNHAATGCHWMGLIADVDDTNSSKVDTNAQTRPVLHVWGGGVNRRIYLGEKLGRDDVMLADQPRDSVDYYFVQLELGTPDQENKSHDLLSEVYSLRTFEDCKRNLLHLTFTPPVRTDKKSISPYEPARKSG